MRNFFTRFHSVVLSVVGCCILCSLLPLASRAQELQPVVFNQEIRWPDFRYYQQHVHIDMLIDRAALLGVQQADSTQWLLMQALERSKRWQYPEGMAKAQSYLGRIFFLKNDLVRSKAFAFKALPYLQRSGKLQRMLANVYNVLGTAYALQGKKDSALTYYYHSLQVAEKMVPKDSLLLANVYTNIVGGVLMGYAGYSGKKEQALYYLNLARPLATGLGARGALILSNIYINTGMVYDRIAGDTALAMANYRLGLDQLRNVGGGAMQSAYYYIGAMYMDRNLYEASKPYIDSAIAADKERFATYIDLNQLLANYLWYKKDYRQSLFYFNRAMDICDRQEAENFKLTLYYFRARLLNEMGQGSRAYQDQKAHSDLLDKLMNKQRVEAVNAMETRYRTAEKDKKLLQSRLQLKQKEARIRETYLWIGGVTVCILFAAMFIISRQRNQQKLLVHQQEIALLSSRMQGEDLERSRIARELHDGVSILLSATKMNFSAIGRENPALAQTEAFREVGSLLNQTVQEVRSISHNLVPGLLIHQSLPAAVQAFCELIRKGYNLKVELLAYGSFAGTGIEWNYTVYRMVQELIHNVVKHAQATEVLIQLTMHDDKLHLTVEDNGIGFVEGKSGMGIGLQSLRQRVEKMQGQFIFSSGPSEGTTVEIEIPLIAA